MSPLNLELYQYLESSEKATQKSEIRPNCYSIKGKILCQIGSENIVQEEFSKFIQEARQSYSFNDIASS